MKNKIQTITRRLLNKRAVSPVISDVIMAGAIIAMGFSLLLWTQNESSDFNLNYVATVDAGLSSVKEKLVFEYTFYNNSGSKLDVFLLNCGQSDNLSLANVCLSNSSWSRSFPNITLRLFDGTIIHHLNMSDQGYLTIPVTLEAGNSYSIRIVTYRGRCFDTTFIA